MYINTFPVLSNYKQSLITEPSWIAANYKEFTPKNTRSMQSTQIGQIDVGFCAVYQI